VCFYEFVCGFLPFGEELDDPYEIYKIRMDCDYVSFPENVKNKKAKK
jgi:cGMP-dependent protein kinase